MKHVENAQGRVLVHCIAGVSRSVTFLLMHLIAVHRVALRQAYDFVHFRRPYIIPNEGFRLQLALFEIEHKGKFLV